MKKLFSFITAIFFSTKFVWAAENATTAARALQTKASNLYYLIVILFVIVMLYIFLYIMYLALESMNRGKMRGDDEYV
jgi:ABC-type multidrug transport system permease subunit|tara:strand:- start:602 stop:835 length:234 start_codon:yes stop_codon:yes gene_type:complete